MGVKEEIGKELKLQLKMGYDISRIVDWAFSFYSDHESQLTSQTRDVLRYIISMEGKTEVEFPKERLNLLAERLQQNEEDPLKEFNPELEFQINKNIDKTYCCRICGREYDFPPWREDGQSPTYEICDCCGVEFGYEDCNMIGIRKYREKWLDDSSKWKSPRLKPKNWALEEQLKQIPEEFR